MSPAADAPLPHWRAPVAPAVIVRRFHEVAPFAPGGHRGLDLHTAVGQRVGAPCAGRVIFQGAVAGGPPTVTISCGALRATVQRVSPSVVAGQRVGRGARIGAATQGALDLSARRADGSYVDPARLLAVRGRISPPVGAIRPVGRGGRPALPVPQPSRPVRLADRALVNLQAGQSNREPVSSRPARVDVPLGVAGVVLILLVAASWTARTVRRWRPRAVSAGRAGISRVQR
ncbi:MAG: M23 family metallopeptidase [Solirubrobacteraceae bacterium]|nr:M23 family metallopeptidase [Solirubrobacteraceae bacterium]